MKNETGRQGFVEELIENVASLGWLKSGGEWETRSATLSCTGLSMTLRQPSEHDAVLK